MPRKAFMADLAAASQVTIQGVSNIARGAEDGEIEFTFTPASGAAPIVVTIISGGTFKSIALAHLLFTAKLASRFKAATYYCHK